MVISIIIWLPLGENWTRHLSRGRINGAVGERAGLGGSGNQLWKVEDGRSFGKCITRQGIKFNLSQRDRSGQKVGGNLLPTRLKRIAIGRIGWKTRRSSACMNYSGSREPGERNKTDSRVKCSTTLPDPLGALHTHAPLATPPLFYSAGWNNRSARLSCLDLFTHPLEIASRRLENERNSSLSLLTSLTP